MSTVKAEKQIEALISGLQDESLRRIHNSVKISFGQMLKYIDKIIERADNKHIKLLLDTFRELAPSYFTQFELSLLEEIKKQNDLQDQLQAVVKQVGDGNANNLAKEVLLDRSVSAKFEYERLTQKFPTLLQNALDKLRDEWQRIDTIAVASQTLAEDEDLIQSLEAVVEVAALSVGIYDERIIVVPGRQFALDFFSYLDNFAILTVPIYSVRAPWEWSIFWHELAGHQVRFLAKGTKKIEIDLQSIFENYRGRNDAQKFDLGENKSGAAYLKKLFQENELDLVDLGGFEYQYERVLANLPEENKFDIYEYMKTRGWCVEWFKELFEDSYSILTFGSEFLDYFENILSRHGFLDGRHPPKEIRVGMAKALLALADADLLEKDPEEIRIENLPELSEQDKIVIKIVAKQITKFSSLVSISNANKTLTQLESLAISSKESLSYARQNAALGVVLQLFAFEEYYKEVVENIKSSIKNWTETTPDQGILGEIKLPSDEKIAGFLGSIEQKKTPVASYKKLLEERDYKQLLELSFYEVDYGTASVTNVFYNIQKRFDSANLMSLPIDVVLGAVSYVDGSNIRRNTSLDDWNAAAAIGYSIQL